MTDINGGDADKEIRKKVKVSSNFEISSIFENRFSLRSIGFHDIKSYKVIIVFKYLTIKYKLVRWIMYLFYNESIEKKLWFQWTFCFIAYFK